MPVILVLKIVTLSINTQMILVKSFLLCFHFNGYEI